MKKILENPVLNLLARLIVGIVFLYAAVGKIADPHTFSKEIANYNLMIDSGVNLIALILPWMELVLAVFLIAGIRQRTSAILSAVLMLVFIVAVAGAMIQGLDINCGCFAESSAKVGWRKLFENFGLLLCSVYIAFFPVEKLSLENLIDRKKLSKNNA